MKQLVILYILSIVWFILSSFAQAEVCIIEQKYTDGIIYYVLDLVPLAEFTDQGIAPEYYVTEYGVVPTIDWRI